MIDNEKYIPYCIYEKIIKNHTFWEDIIDITDNLYTKIIFSEGEINFINGDRFKGKMINSIMTGYGEYYYVNGIVYKGEFENNKLNGKGKLLYDEESFYEGDFKNGKKNGYGILNLKEENIIYKGNFEDDEFNGEGLLEYSDKSVYEGSFKDGMRYGFGIYKYNNGNIFEGYFKNNIKDGIGKMIWNDKNEELKGFFKNNLPNGFSRYLWKNDNKLPFNRYEGEYLNGKRHGIGCFYYSNGNIYIGEWKENLKDGFSIFINEDGIKKFWIFKKNKLIKELEFKNKNLDLEFNIENKVKKTKLVKKLKIQNNPYKNCLYIKDLYLEENKKIIYDIILRYNHILINIYKNNNHNMKIECGSYFSMESFWNILYKYRLVNSYLSIANFNRLILKRKNSVSRVTNFHYYNKLKVNFYKAMFDDNIEDLISRFDEEDENNNSYKYLDYFMFKHNNILNFYHNSNYTMLLRNFIQNLIYAINLKSYNSSKKRYNLSNNYNKNWIYHKDNFHIVLKDIMQHIQDIHNEEKVAKPNFNDIKLVFEKSKQILMNFDDSFKKFYNLLIKGQTNHNKLKKFNAIEDKLDINSYLDINELINKNKNNYKYIITKDYQFLVLKEVYKFFSDKKYFEYKVEEYNKNNLLINHNTIQMDRIMLFFKCFEKDHDPEESYLYYYTISKKLNKINSLFTDLMNKVFIRKINYELIYEEFRDCLYLFIVKHNNLVTKDKRFQQKIEKILTNFFNEIFDLPIKSFNIKKIPRSFPFSQKDKDLKNIKEIKKRKKKEKILQLKWKKEKESEKNENMRMSNNDYNCLLIKNCNDEISEISEEIFDDIGDSVYIFKNKNINK